MLGCDDYIHIVFALDAVVEAGKQTVCIRRQVHPHNIRLLICNMVEHSRVLMRESVVILLPYIRSQNQIERSNLLSPRELVADLQPFCVL